jgi:hypothetical protein
VPASWNSGGFFEGSGFLAKRPTAFPFPPLNIVKATIMSDTSFAARRKRPGNIAQGFSSGLLEALSFLASPSSA